MTASYRFGALIRSVVVARSFMSFVPVVFCTSTNAAPAGRGNVIANRGKFSSAKLGALL